MSFATHTAFSGFHHLASGPLPNVAIAVKRALEGGTDAPLLIFNNRTGHPVDINPRGSDEEVLARLPQTETPASAQSDELDATLSQTTEVRRRPGRPKLNVVGREVTLLPRHWEWLNAQPGGASVSLRKLVDEARRKSGRDEQLRKARDAAYYFMSNIAGNLPGFEEAARSLFANDRARFASIVGQWPKDIGNHATTLAFAEPE